MMQSRNRDTVRKMKEDTVNNNDNEVESESKDDGGLIKRNRGGRDKEHEIIL